MDRVNGGVERREEKRNRWREEVKVYKYMNVCMYEAVMQT